MCDDCVGVGVGVSAKRVVSVFMCETAPTPNLFLSIVDTISVKSTLSQINDERTRSFCPVLQKIKPEMGPEDKSNI